MTDEIQPWAHRMMVLALHVGGWSKDKSIGLGCVIEGSGHSVISVGFNGFPRGVRDDIPDRFERPAKYLWTEHAERNAIYNAARNGIKLDGATMYVPWFPCAACARSIVQVGIRRLVALEPDWGDPTWADDFSVSRVLLHEGAVELVLLDERDLESLDGEVPRPPRTADAD